MQYIIKYNTEFGYCIVGGLKSIGEEHIAYFNNYRQFHNIGAPALLLSSGYEEWIFNDLTHREDGPAVTYSDGMTEFWYHGVRLHHITSTAGLAKWLKFKHLV